MSLERVKRKSMAPLPPMAAIGPAGGVGGGAVKLSNSKSETNLTALSKQRHGSFISYVSDISIEDDCDRAASNCDDGGGERVVEIVVDDTAAGGGAGGGGVNGLSAYSDHSAAVVAAKMHFERQRRREQERRGRPSRKQQLRANSTSDLLSASNSNNNNSGSGSNTKANSSFNVKNAGANFVSAVQTFYGTLKHSASAANTSTLAPTSTAGSSSTSSLRSISPINRGTTAKHEQHSTAATAAATAVQAAAAAANSTASSAAAAANATATANALVATTAAAAAGNASSPPTEKEKEKKRKEVSSSRVKKFHRHFSQVSKDEKLINYFSCALVSDILLQGHLYITDQHFAFYSNVFGYVTKVVIPTSSVTKISKEKTAKIIPNAVGVATADERHVFGSFISREAAYRLMCSVCYTPCAPPEIVPKLPADIEISEEYSIEDDSSCSISGNESPPQNAAAAAAVAAGTATAAAAGAGPAGVHLGDGQTLLRRTVISSSLTISTEGGKRAQAQEHQSQRHSDIPVNAKTVNSSASNATNEHGATTIATATATTTTQSSSSSPLATPFKQLQSGISNLALGTTNANNTTMPPFASATSSTPSSPSSTSTSLSSATTTIAGGGLRLTAKPKLAAHAVCNNFKNLTRNIMLRFKFPTDLNVVYLGVLLSLLLALFSIFLLYRILNIEAKTSFYNSPADFNWRSSNDDEIFAEALRWHRELQAKSTEEAQTILNTNLEQIAKVRRSLETLSMLIHDRSSAYGSANQRDDSD